AAGGRYGRFVEDGRAFAITDPRTPRPWVNVISNPSFGLVVSQAGGGFTWVENSQLAVITRWEQDLIRDRSGKFLYLRDGDSGAEWSAAPAPVWAPWEEFECRHGLGYTTFTMHLHGIRSRWTLFVHPGEPVELWLVELANSGERERTLELMPYLEWNCGVAPSPRREFTKLFIENDFDTQRGIAVATSHMWEVPSERWGHWNTSFPFVAAFGGSLPVTQATGDKEVFLGRYGDLARPAALRRESWPARFGRHGDPVVALRSRVVVPARGAVTVGFALAVGRTREEAEARVAAWRSPEVMRPVLAEVGRGWLERLQPVQVATPEASLDTLVNLWLPYQTISARLWGRCGYYQQSGAFGFRDQLQDSQLWLGLDPPRCKAQILLHAAHQFADGSVYHWWHPLSEQGHVTRMSDDLLWLAYVTASYLRETRDFSILDEAVPFLDDPHPAPLAEHVRRAFARVRRRSSPRGLPFIGAGDWNDGLSAVGLEERGESVWLAQFLAGLLADWAEIARRTGDEATGRDYRAWREALVTAINAHAWDGEWFVRAWRDDGQPLGSRTCERGTIYLNAQSWAVLNDVTSPERAAACLAAVKKHLVTEVGALLLTPAYDRPVREIGYITRYAPGMRENGGVYTHAATWAIAAAAKLRDAELVGRLLAAINPVGKDPEQYWAEPYVLPGNVDGPESPHFGRGGWTWYTGSAAWLHRVVTQWVLGVRPEWEGLRIDPCLPPGWRRASLVRPWCGAVYRVDMESATGVGGGAVEALLLDGEPVGSPWLPVPDRPGATHRVQVRLG
ncbi:MAG: glycosyl transferase family 36, partial [Acidobacteriota bacterium]